MDSNVNTHSDVLAKAVAEIDFDMKEPDDELELFDEELQASLEQDLQSRPDLQKAMDEIMAESSNKDEFDDVDVGTVGYTTELRPLPTESLLQGTTASHEPMLEDITLKVVPSFIEVRVFVRQDSNLRAMVLLFGTFLVPFLPRCLQEASTYHSIITKAQDLLKKTRPYVQINQFFDIDLAKPVFTFIAAHGFQYHVDNQTVPRFVNRGIPEPLYTEMDKVILTMVTSVDLHPKFNLHEVRHLMKTKSRLAHKQRHTKAAKQKLTNRLGPPVQRPFVDSKENQPPTMVINASPQPSTSNPEAHCWAPKAKQGKDKAMSLLINQAKKKHPLKPKKLFQNNLPDSSQ
jgi:hypothetical protein